MIYFKKDFNNLNFPQTNLYSLNSTIINPSIYIIINNEAKQGFFFIIKKLKLLFIYDYILPKEYLTDKFQINILIDFNSNKIINYNNKRFIKIFKTPLKATIIQIFDEDKISDNLFLFPDFNYKNDFKYYKYKKIYSIIKNENQNFKNEGEIIDIVNDEFKYNSNRKFTSPGLPILLEENNNIIGIQNQEKSNNSDNYGFFIGVFLYQLEYQDENKIKELKKQNEKIIKNNNNILYLDLIIKKECQEIYPYYNFFTFLKKEKNSEIFVKASIFGKDYYKNIKSEFENKLKINNFTDIEKSCIGSILGMALGDAIGARVEFLPLKYNSNAIKDIGDYPGGKFYLNPGQWTDDTSMGLCLADSLIEKKGEFDPRDIMMRFILWWYYGYNNAFRFDDNRKYNKHSIGLGGNISGSFSEYIKNYGKSEYTTYGDKNTSGNGSIMRNAAIPLCYFNDEKKALKYAKKQSLITHQGDEAAGCCQLLTFIIIKILKFKLEGKICSEMKDIIENLENFNCDYNSVNYLARSKPEEKDKNKDWNWKVDNFKYSENRAKKQPTYIGSYCMDCLSMALHILYHTNTFKDAILRAINLRGDADSLGSVVGQIAGAFYGLDSIPVDWIKKLNIWDHNEIALSGYTLCHLNK